jgi:hypothetical protein
MLRFFAMKLDIKHPSLLNAPQSAARMGTDPADICGAEKLFVVAAAILSDAF